MPDYRFFTSHPLHQKSSIIFVGEEYRHVVKVMRGEIGDRIELIDGKGHLAEALIERIEHKEVLCTVDRVDHFQKKSGPILVQALPRLNRLEYIVEKATELGIAELWLVPTEKSERYSLSAHQKERLIKISIASLKQSGELYLPPILLKPPLKEWQPLRGPLFFGDTRPDSPIFRSLGSVPTSLPLYLLIGSEAGLSLSEVEFLEKNLGGKGFKIHPNTLRVDTAAISGLALLSQLID